MRHVLEMQEKSSGVTRVRPRLRLRLRVWHEDHGVRVRVRARFGNVVTSGMSSGVEKV